MVARTTNKAPGSVNGNGKAQPKARTPSGRGIVDMGRMSPKSEASRSAAHPRPGTATGAMGTARHRQLAPHPGPRLPGVQRLHRQRQVVGPEHRPPGGDRPLCTGSQIRSTRQTLATHRPAAGSRINGFIRARRRSPARPTTTGSQAARQGPSEDTCEAADQGTAALMPGTEVSSGELMRRLSDSQRSEVREHLASGKVSLSTGRSAGTQR